jgi:hypothetical protein
LQKNVASVPKSGKMKIEEVEQSEEDDDCYVIEPLEISKKLSLEVPEDIDDNDVVLVAAKGPVRFHSDN